MTQSQITGKKIGLILLQVGPVRTEDPVSFIGRGTARLRTYSARDRHVHHEPSHGRTTASSFLGALSSALAHKSTANSAAPVEACKLEAICSSSMRSACQILKYDMVGYAMIGTSRCICACSKSLQPAMLLLVSSRILQLHTDVHRRAYTDERTDTSSQRCEGGQSTDAARTATRYTMFVVEQEFKQFILCSVSVC